jgi:hypothetical protein
VNKETDIPARRGAGTPEFECADCAAFLRVSVQLWIEGTCTSMSEYSAYACGGELERDHDVLQQIAYVFKELHKL